MGMPEVQVQDMQQHFDNQELHRHMAEAHLALLFTDSFANCNNCKRV